MLAYEWVNGARFNAEAQPVGERVERIRKHHHGRITAAMVVEDSRNTTSPLHPCLEWNDQRAAHQHRLAQARGILRSLVVVVDEQMPEPVRAFVAVNVTEEDGEGEGKSYTSIMDAFNDPELREQVLESALHELKSWRTRYHRLNELARVFRVIDRQLELTDV